MSIALNIQNYSKQELTEIGNDLTIEIKPNHFSFNKFQVRSIYAFDVEDNTVYLPFAYAMDKKLDTRPNFKKQNKIDFNGSLREQQLEIKNEVFQHIKKKGSSIIAAYPGFGKTCTSIYIACKLRVKTLIVIHRIVLMKQWKQSILKFCKYKNPDIKEPLDDIVQLIDSKTEKLNPNAFFYIMNATNVVKKPHSFFKDIGFLIIDENHLIMAESLSKCMIKLTPRYVLGLSATPYREDGLNCLLDFYFGKDKIHKKLFKKHTVYKVETKFKPEVYKNQFTGKTNWGKILDQQANNDSRNDLIVNIVQKYKERNFLILCKRIKQGKTLLEKLKQKGESVTSLLGKQQQFDSSCRILVGTSSKAGVGFDHQKLNALILASDIQAYFIQYLGRVLRRPDVEPLVFDLVDDNKTLERHYKVRRNIYLQHGGTVEVLHIHENGEYEIKKERRRRKKNTDTKKNKINKINPLRLINKKEIK